MGEFRENSSDVNEIAKRYIPFAQMLADNLLWQAEVRKEGKDFQKGMLTGLLTSLCNMMVLYHPDVSEEETMAIAQRVTNHLCQNPKIKELIGGWS